MSTVSERSVRRSRRWLRYATSVGDSPHVHGEPTLYIDGELHIGHRFRLASSPAPSHLVAGPGARLQIGDDVSIGQGAAISAFENIVIGDGTRIAPFAIVMDTNFHGTSGSQAIEHDCKPVLIGRGCRIGTRVTITRGATIGDGAEVLAGSVVSSDVPAGMCVAGARARIIGLAGDVHSRWDSPTARLPELLVTALGLPSAPDLDHASIPSSAWTDGHVEALLRELGAQFGIALEIGTVRHIGTYAELASAVADACADARPAA